MKYLVNIRHLMLMITLVFSAYEISAEPYVPENNEFVLATLALDSMQPEAKNIKKLKQLLKFNPKDPLIASDLANSYIAMAKKYVDPRYYGLAETVIKPWWDKDSSLDIMLIKARILEFGHAFSDAILVLDKILRTRQFAQANLMRANIHQVVGDYEKVKHDCKRLMLKTSMLITASCLFSVDAFTSDAVEAAVLSKRLESLLDTDKNVSVSVKLWVLGLIAEAASLHNNWKVAEEMMQRGLNAKADDVYLLSLYADLLLKQDRFQDCINLLTPHIKQTALLVRYLAAKTKVSGSKLVGEGQENLDFRIREDAIKGDQRHFREYAYYQLYVQKNYQVAFENALINWQNQKELIDSLLLYRIASHLNKVDVLTMLSRWGEKNNLKINFAAQSLRI